MLYYITGITLDYQNFTTLRQLCYINGIVLHTSIEFGCGNRITKVKTIMSTELHHYTHVIMLNFRNYFILMALHYINGITLY